MSAILKRELSAYFHGAIGYVVLAVFFFFSGTSFAIQVAQKSADLGYVFTDMFVIILLLIPIITMKSFAEEKRQRTDQALFTAPLSLFEIVAGKFLGAFILYACCVSIFIVYGLIISIFNAPNWTIILSTTMGLLLYGAALIAIDIFISALTESQIISAITGVAAGFFITKIDDFAQLTNSDFLSKLLYSVSFNENLSTFRYGIISFPSILFFLSVVVIFSFLTIRVFEKKRWA